MKLGVRLLFVFFLLNGLAAFFVLRVFTAEIRPSAREVMEDLMVDTANLLAELAAPDLAAGRLADGAFAAQVSRYARRPVDAGIWGLRKQSLDFRVYVTDARGLVLFDSSGAATGQDYARWRDVARTLRGEYGARATREITTDERSAVMYVAAPVLDGDRLIGVLTVAKPLRSVQAFIDRAERKVLLNGLLLLGLSALVGVAVTLWVVWHIRRLRRYAQSVQAGDVLPVPRAPGELGELASAMQAMRQRLDGRQYVDGYVRALTHELKSPVAALRASGELLQDDLPAPDRERFAAQVVAQSERLQRLIDRVLELSKLEQQAGSDTQPRMGQALSLQACVDDALSPLSLRFQARAIDICLLQADGAPGGTGDALRGDPALIVLAISNLLENALDFAPPGSQVTVTVAPRSVTVQDQGPGVPDYAFAHLGERFYTTPRPGGERSGSGMGLAIVRQIMRLHRGELVLRNAGGLRAELRFTPG